MAGELSLEEMGSKLGSFESKLDTFIASAKLGMDNHDKMKDEKEAAIKKANDEKKENDHKEARAKLASAIKKAEEEPTDEKKEAAMKKAVAEYGDEHNDKDKKEAMDNHDKNKMNNEHVAAIILDKKIEIDNKILQAASMSNPIGLPALKKELENGSFTASKKMYEDMEKMFGKAIFQAAVPTPTITQAPPFFMAGAVAPHEMDSNQLNASSSVMEFSKLSTKDLLDGKI